MIFDGHLIPSVTRGKEVRSGSKVLGTYLQLMRKREIRRMKLKEKRDDRVVAIVITRLLSSVLWPLRESAESSHESSCIRRRFYR